MSSLSKGANVALESLKPSVSSVVVGLGWQPRAEGPPLDLDAVAMLVGADGRCGSSEDVVYYNRRRSPDGSVALSADNQTGAGAGDDESLTVDLASLPTTTTKVVIAVSIHQAQQRQQTFAQLQDAHIRLLDPSTGAELTRFDLGELGPETAVVFGELYRHNSAWKFRAVGQGYVEGLAGIGRDFGVPLGALDLTKATPTGPAPTPSAPAPSAPAVGSAGPAASGRVVLTKSAPRVSLTKADKPGGLMRVNLNWTARPDNGQGSGGGFLKRLSNAGQAGIDLDLGCLYEFADGSLGAVQALGNAFASRSTGSTQPLIRLDGDDRSGQNSGGENLFIDLGRPAEIVRILVFAYIYEGTPNWAQANAAVTMFPTSGAEVVVPLDEHDPRSKVCAIAMLTNVGGEIQVNREVKYIQGSQAQLDRAYGWGINWSAGRK